MLVLTILLSPFNLLFLITIAGFAIGKIRMKHISLGIAGILFAGMMIGTLINRFIPTTYMEIVTNTQSTMKVFSKLGTSLFVSVIGLQTGFSIKNNSKESLLAFIIGGLMSMAGVIIMQLISVLDKGISYSSLLGILCGALTSTPGLSSVCELVGTDSEEAVLGYGYSYLFGVIFVVIFVQILSCSVAEKVLPKTKSPSTTGNIYPELILINITALFGNILGTLHIPFLHISIGNTASTLLIGLTVGYIVQRNFANVQISSHIINSFKNLGLALFFTGTGFASGLQSVAFDIKSVLYGALITLTAILFGWMLCKIVSIRCLLHNGFVIAGGMTSSPAYGTIRSKASENSINQFSFAYFGALISLVIAIQIIGR